MSTVLVKISKILENFGFKSKFGAFRSKLHKFWSKSLPLFKIPNNLVGFVEPRVTKKIGRKTAPQNRILRKKKNDIKEKKRRPRANIKKNVKEPAYNQ